MTFFSLSSQLPPPPPLVLYRFFFFFHTIVTLLQQEPVMVNCLTFLIVPWCCAVWSVSTWFSPHTSREVCYCGHLCLVGIGGVVCVLLALVPAFVSIRFVEMCSYDASRQPFFFFFGSVPARSAKIENTACDTALNRQKGVL